MKAVLAALLLVAAAGASQAAEAFVMIDNFSFTPAQITVPAGTVVTWINRDDIPHLVIGGGEQTLLKSPALDTDDRFSAVFETPGTFGYFCSLHPHMQGSVIVQ